MLRFWLWNVPSSGALPAERFWRCRFQPLRLPQPGVGFGESIAETVHDALASQGGFWRSTAGDRMRLNTAPLSAAPGAELTHASIIQNRRSVLDATGLGVWLTMNCCRREREPVQRVAADHRACSRPEARLTERPLSAKWALWKIWRGARSTARLAGAEGTAAASGPSEEAFSRPAGPVRLVAV